MYDTLERIGVSASAKVPYVFPSTMLDNADQPTLTMGNFNHSPHLPHHTIQRIAEIFKEISTCCDARAICLGLSVKAAQANWVKQYLGNTTPNAGKI